MDATVQAPLLATADRTPLRTAIVDGQQTMSFRQVADAVAASAARLRDSGVQPGDRVSVFLDKSADCVVALYAIWCASAIVVPVNEALKSRQITHILQDSDSRFLVTNERMCNRVNLSVPDGVRIVRVNGTPAGPQSQVAGERAPDDAAAILYTSGSTGRPKGIVISHGNLRAGARIVIQYLGLRSDDRILSVLPFSFDYGLNQLLTAAQVGATVVLQRSHRPSDICRTLAETQITGCAGVPPMWIQLMSEMSPFRRMRFPHLRYITNSGGRLPVALVREYRAQLPDMRIFLMYGLSEAFRSTYLDPSELDLRPDSIGKAIPETEIHVLDAEGRVCPPDLPGELVHEGPTVAIGYWKDPDATRSVFRTTMLPGHAEPQRCVFSGDMVRRDRQGFLYFIGRNDGMIKSQGFRVSPEEVEELLLASGLVNEAAVCGKPDELSGQIVEAHVVPMANVERIEWALSEFCRREMPAYMQPRRIVVHPELPRTASGKLNRKQLAANDDQ